MHILNGCHCENTEKKYFRESNKQKYAFYFSVLALKSKFQHLNTLMDICPFGWAEMCLTVLISTTHPVLTFSSLSPQPFVTCTQ